MLEFAADGGATLGHRIVEAGAPQLEVMDLSATRGDGIFETISTRAGKLQALEPHLARFAHSAAILELPPPDLDEWRDAVRDVAARLGPADEGFVKIVLTRGVEGQDDPTGWAYAAASPDHTPARTTGIRIVLLDRGYRHDVAQTSPWLLAGAKTLSYAVNRAAFREAARRDADDALFVSSDGYLLEGADLEPGAAHRQAHRHPADRPRHPDRHDAGGPVPLGGGRRATRPATSCSRPRTCSPPTPPGWCRACGTRRPCARSTARRSRSIASCRMR